MKVIFLDVDGVLITAATCRKGFGIVDKRCVNLLNRLTNETGAKLVISSCWRTGQTVEELQEQFKKWGVTGKIIGSTGDYKTKRGYEIGEWLQCNAKVEAFVIIDDDADMAGLLKHLVQTNMRTGLTAAHCAAAKTQLVSGDERT